jgi:hypothetical protein
MLRCAGCGELVSEWAARCPNCRRTTDDAVDAAPAAKRRWATRTNLVAIASATLLAAAASAAALAASDHGTATPVAATLAPPRLEGRVIGEDQSGGLFLSRPDGTHSRHVRPNVFGTGDQALAVAGVDQIVGANSAGKIAASSLREISPSATAAVLATSPFTDNRRAVVMVQTGSSAISVAWVVPLRGGPAISLGSADSAAGDPLNTGAFVTVITPEPTSPEPSSGPRDQQPDERVELRDVGHPGLVLATAARLNAAAGNPPGESIHVSVFPDPSGQKIAVALSPTTGPESNSAMVVLGRNGDVIRSLSGPMGPAEHTPLYWSPDGEALAYETFGSTGTDLAVADLATRLSSQALEPSTSIDGCTWSPDSHWLLCQAVSQFTNNWILARNDATLTPIYSVRAGHRPLAWLQ